MCGILGVWHAGTKLVDLGRVRHATTLLRHRGPDDEGFLLANTATGRTAPCGGTDTDPSLDLSPLEALVGQPFNLAFGFRRLSILDLSAAGHQPMASSDGRFWIVFNGEIYNYLELRAELISYGYEFRTGTDTEVILAAYQQWGARCLLRFCGMWAFGIWDRQENRLFLARDHFGIKPLYYTQSQDGFAFASEIKALLALPGVSRRVNPQRLYDYLRYGLTDHASETLFSEICQLPPAHYLEIPLDRPYAARPVRYWQIDLGKRTELSFEEAAAHLRELFLENIALHLRSDVPVGAALSGGIDSSAIVTAMRHLQGQSLEFHTFSYIANEASINEERWVDCVNQAAAAEAHKVRTEPHDLVADLDHLIATQDEPFGSTSMYAQYRVFRLAHDAGIKVMLDGQGADELLGGYRSFLAVRFASLLRQGQWIEGGQFMREALKLPGTNLATMVVQAGALVLPRGVKKPFRRLVNEDLIPPWLDAAWFTARGVGLYPFPPNTNSEALRENLYHTLTETSVPMLLRYEDRNSMASSIESRVPFLTPALASFVFCLPENYIIAPDGTSKAVFRKAMRGIVPDTVLDRNDKVGFATPEHEWLTVLRPWVEAVLDSEAAAEIPALRSRGVKEEWQAVLSGRTRFDWRVWRWINLIRWSEQNAVDWV